MAETNGWSAYEKLVLSKLESLDKGQQDLNSSYQALTTRVALVDLTLSKQADFDGRIQKLETGAITQDTLRAERKWVFVTAIAIVGSILIPILVILISGGTGVF